MRNPYERRKTRNATSSILSLDKCDSHIEQLMMLALTRVLPKNAEIFQQFRIGKYKADFLVCGSAKKIVIECDGKQYHTRVNQVIHDKNRDEFMRSLGYEIIRFSGSDIFKNHESCALKVREELLRPIEVNDPEVSVKDSVDPLTKIKYGDIATRNLLALCGDHPRLIARLSEEALQGIDNPALSALLRDARNLSLGGEATSGAAETLEIPLVSVDKLIALAPQEVRSLVATEALSGKFKYTENPDENLDRICRDLRAHAIQREVIDLQKQLIGSNGPIRDNILDRCQTLTFIRSCLLSNKPIPKPAEVAAAMARESADFEASPQELIRRMIALRNNG